MSLLFSGGDFLISVADSDSRKRDLTRRIHQETIMNNLIMSALSLLAFSSSIVPAMVGESISVEDLEQYLAIDDREKQSSDSE